MKTKAWQKTGKISWCTLLHMCNIMHTGHKWEKKKERKGVDKGKVKIALEKNIGHVS